MRNNMKMTLQKIATITFDTSIERKRIAKAFRNRKDIRVKLDKLMDLIEQEKWEEALSELQSKWWSGRDDKDECPRLEYVGLIHHPSPHFSNWMSYIDLVINMCDSPEVYKIIDRKVKEQYEK